MTQPEFHLCRINQDGSRGPIQIFRVEDVPLSIRLSRRGFLGCGLSVSAILAAMSSGCVDQYPQAEGIPSRPPPAPTNVPAEEPVFDPKIPFFAHLSPVGRLFMDFAGSLLVSVSAGSPPERKVWRLPKGTLLGSLPCAAYEAPALPKSPPPMLEVIEGKLLACTGESLAATPLPVLVDPSSRPALTPDGTLGVIWQGGEQPLLQLFSLDSGASRGELRPLPADAGRGAGWEGVAVSADGQRVTAGWKDRPIHIWSLPDKRLIAMFSGAELSAAADQVTVSQSGQLVLVRTKTTVDVWLIADRQKQLHIASPRPESAQFTEVQGDLASSAAGPMEHIRITENVSEPAIHFLEARFTPDDQHVLVRRTVSPKWVVWSLSQRQQVAVHEELGTVSPNGSLMAVLTQKDVAIHDFPSGKLLTSLCEHEHAVRSVCFSGDGRLVAVGDEGGMVTLWELPQGSRVAYLNDPQVTELAWQKIEVDKKGASYNVYDSQLGKHVTSTKRCGSPLPPGAVCTCNCVPGVAVPSEVCDCNPVCSCNPVCTCVPVSTPGERICTCIPVRIRRF